MTSSSVESVSDSATTAAEPHVLGAAVMGAGTVSRRHAATLAGDQRVALRWICDPQQPAGEKLATDFGGTWTASPEDVMNDAAVHLVYICTPNHLHHELALRALAAGKHVFIEKPVANTPEQARQVCEAARTHGRTVVVGHQYRHLPAFARAKQLINEGAIGEVRAVVDRIAANYNLQRRPAWFLDKETSGGGALMNNGVHQIDRAFWLLDERPTTVSARVGCAFPGYAIDSDVQALFATPRGRTVQMILCAYPCASHNCIEVYGTTGQLYADGRGVFRLYRAAEPEIDETLPSTTNGADVLLNDLILGAREGKPSETGPEWGAFVVDTAHAIYRAADAGQTLRLDAE